MQNRIVKGILDTFPELSGDDVRAALMGEAGVDIKLMSERARELVPFAIEAKNQEALSIWSALKQTEANAAKEEREPALVFTRNHAPDYVAVRLDFLLILLSYRALTGAE